MKQPNQFLLVLFPLLLASGCGNLPFIGGDEPEVAPAPVAIPPAGQPIPAAPAQADNAAAANADAETAEGEDFEDPLVEGENKPKAPRVAEGLIPLASEDAAAKLAQSGRQDPFATLPVDAETLASRTGSNNTQNLETVLPNLPKLPGIPDIQVPGAIGPLASQVEQVVLPNELPQAPKLPSVPDIIIPPGIGPRTPQPEPEPQPEPPPLPDVPFSDVPLSPDELPEEEPFSPELPDLPEPTLANELVVTGVVTSKGIAQAIVEGADGKSTYVQEGDYVANGQVLVKRIEANKGGLTLVIFEELGIEVVKNVGQGASVS